MLPEQLSDAVTDNRFTAGIPAVPQTVNAAGHEIVGAVLSILVLYDITVEFPQLSVVVTVIVALQVPAVAATSVNAPGQLSVADVAAKAAASAKATVA